MSDYILQKRSLPERMMSDATWLGSRVPHIHALIEVDVTDLRRMIKGNKEISLTGSLTKAIADVLIENNHLMVCRTLRSRIAKYSTVDLFFPMEAGRELKPVILRDAQTRSVEDLSESIKRQGAIDKVKISSEQKAFLQFPYQARKLLYRWVARKPRLWKQYFGTAYISSILNYSHGRRSFGIPSPMHSIGFFLGALEKRVSGGKNTVEVRDIQQITVTADHRFVHGADMAKLIRTLTRNIEHPENILNL